MAESTLQNVLESGPSTGRQVAFGSQDRGSERYPERNLMKLKGEEQAKEIIRLWIVQEPLHRKHKAQWKVNRYRRGGTTGVLLIKRQDTQEWQAYAPPGSSRQVPALNKAARLCRLLRSTMFVDPPVPEASPASDADEDRDAAEFSTRVLIDLSNEGNLNNAATAERAFDRGSIYGSGFRVYHVDPNGGGQRPYAVQAIAAAQRFDPTNPESSLIDPTTGQIAPGPYVTKYVREDFTLSDDPRDPAVQMRWLPKLKQTVQDGRHVRPLPAVCSDIAEAQGVLIGNWATLDTLNSLFPKSMPQDEETIKKLLTRPNEDVIDLLPGGRSNRAVLDTSKINGDSLAFTLTCYYKQSGAYPFGYHGVAAGNGILLLPGEEWYDREAREPLELPIDQFKQMDDGEHPDDFYGEGSMQITGPGNEIRAGVLGAQLEHLDRFNNRKVFYPITSPLTPKTMQAATGTYIPVTPGGIPKTEDVPDFPHATSEMFETISAEMQSDMGLEPPATGQNPSSVQSGLHARTIIEQVNVGLSDIRNNQITGLTRGWRIQLQLVRKYYTVPQRIAWTGDDGVYKEREWRGADLGSTRDVMLHKGSLSMLAPSAKLAVAEQMATMMVGDQPLIEAEDLRRIVIGNVGGLIGLQDDPHRLRIRRQIGQWSEGPPKGWTPQPPTAVDPVTQQPAPDPVLGKIWAPVLVDEDRMVAFVRAHELGRLLAGTKYQRQLPEWRAPVDAEYDRMRHAAGLQTVAEEQAAQQAVVQQQQQQTDTVAQYTQQVADLSAVAKQLQQQVAQAVKAIPQIVQQSVAAVVQGVEVLAEQVQNLAKAQEAGTKDLVQVAANVDKEITKLRKELEASAAALEGAIDTKVGAVEKTVAAIPPPAPPAPMTFHMGGGDPGEMNLDFVRDAKTQRITGGVMRKGKKKPPPAGGAPPDSTLHPPEPGPIP